MPKDHTNYIVSTSGKKPITAEQRFRADFPCPICNGHPDLPKGQGTRCRGWMGSDGRYAFCTREEHAGDLSPAGKSDAYGHVLEGPCGCGVTHSDGGCTLEQYAQLKQLPVSVLGDFHLTQISYQKAPAVRIPYLDVDGTEITTQYRLARHRDPTHKFKSGSKPHLYGRWRRELAIEAGYVTIAEGPSDCHTLWFHGEPAIGLPGAGSYNEERDGGYFDGIPEINVVIEPDSGGEVVKGWLSQASFRNRARLIDLSPFGVKDPSALHCLDPDQFTTRWAQARTSAVAWVDREQIERTRAMAEAAKQAGDLLDAPDVLALAGKAMADRGYAGDLQPALLAYLALTSRLTDRPMNLAFVARASSGKNRAIDAAVELMPSEAYYEIKAASERVLIYNNEDFKHRFAIFSEADSIPEDGPAASAIRNLAADNLMQYEVTEQDPSTGRFTTRVIRKPGPTGLITTSTTSLGDQLGTRVLEATIPDSEDLTRLIMEAQAREAMGTDRPSVDLTKFVAFQRWLALGGERRVLVPFAMELANLVPAQAVRMRRDFPKLLTAVKTAAMLQQGHRERAHDGGIVARVDDYATARSLLAPVFDAINTEGLTPAIRQTVEAIAVGEQDVTIATLMERLGLEKPSVWYRVRKACAGGWLVNTETKKGQPAKLQRDDPLPEAMTTLPLPEAIEDAVRISVSMESEVRGTPSSPDPSDQNAVINLDHMVGLKGSSQESRPTDIPNGGMGGRSPEKTIDTVIHPPPVDDPSASPATTHNEGTGMDEQLAKKFERIRAMMEESDENAVIPVTPVTDEAGEREKTCADCGTALPGDWIGFYCEQHGGRRPNQTEPDNANAHRPNDPRSKGETAFEEVSQVMANEDVAP